MPSASVCTIWKKPKKICCEQVLVASKVEAVCVMPVLNGDAEIAATCLTAAGDYVVTIDEQRV
jgi:hypothetical protein